MTGSPLACSRAGRKASTSRVKKYFFMALIIESTNKDTKKESFSLAGTQHFARFLHLCSVNAAMTGCVITGDVLVLTVNDVGW